LARRIEIQIFLKARIKNLFFVLAFTGLLAMSATAQTFTTLHSFTGGDGAFPYAGLSLLGSTLYGTAGGGGSSGNGTVFKINTDGTGFATLHSFSAGGYYNNQEVFTNSDGVVPVARLILSRSTMYGTTTYGGNSGSGTLFKINTNGAGFTTLYSFSGVSYSNNESIFTNSDGANPEAGLILSGATLYGTTANGGSSGNGTLFKINTDGTDFTTLHSFTGGDGANPYAGLILSGGTLYGTTLGGGNSVTGIGGTVFKIKPDGTGFTTLHSFTGADGGDPLAGLISSGSTLYGTASQGGSSNSVPWMSGTLFKINTDGTDFTTLHSFSGDDGADPVAGLILSGSTLYGTAYGVGNFASSTNIGTVFKINTDGTGFATLRYFATGGYNNYEVFTNSDGADPYAGLILSGSTLYGTAVFGGISNNGAVFSLTLSSDLPDLVATYLDWDTNEGAGGLEFAYSLLGSSLTDDTDAKLFWAYGTNIADIISFTPIYDELIPADFEVGTTNEVSVESSYLANPPSGATYILLVVDSDNLIMETNKANNTLALSYNPPAITDQPMNRIVIQGSNAVFTVEAMGAEPLEYQWQFNGTNLDDDEGEDVHISGATTDTLNISEVEANDAGSYSVVVSNYEGSATSAVVTLTVAGMQSMIPQSEYSALVDLFSATEGADWKDNSGWLDPSSAEWYGVEVTNLQFDAYDNLLPNSGNVCEIGLEANGLAGSIPSSLNNFAWLETLDLSGNQLQGGIPVFALTFLNRLQTIDLSSNQLSGIIPTGFGNLSLNLKTLDLSANNLSGGIPLDLHGMVQLETLDLSQNNLSSTINLGIMSQLTTLDLSENALGGSLTNIGLFPLLQTMELWGNHISGTIPINSGFFLGLSENTLQQLDMSDNDLDGTIPDFGPFSHLVGLDLSGNQLTGSIPVDFNNLNLLQSLDLSGNNLTNAIPNLGSLAQLQELDLSDNNLIGGIPVSLAILHQLQTVDLSKNHLTNTIVDLSQVSTLTNLQIQYNDLDFITNSEPLGVENNVAVLDMLNYGKNVKWLPQNLPSITSNPKGESVLTNSPNQFSVTLEGAPPMYYQWQFGGTNLSDNSRISGSQANTLSINPVQSADQGTYQVIITNIYGSATSTPAMLTVTTVGVAPQITSQPSNQSIAVGQNAAFSVSAIGSTPLFYQWLLNGTNLLGANAATVVITGVSSSNAGSYTVIVTNSFGAMTNLAGTLIVASVPLSFAMNGAGIQYNKGLVTLQINGLTGVVTAEVETSSNLFNWIPIYTNTTSFGTIQFIDTSATNASMRFYRVVVLP
jgi:uncharacterized repeat protein (TIGR03803 family)